MPAIQISPAVDRQIEIKITSAFDEIINAVENFDLNKLQGLLPNEPVLMQDLERVFNSLKSEGNSHLIAFTGDCSCCIDKNTTIAFKTKGFTETGELVHLKQFGLVFLQNNNTGGYKYFKLCAHIDWKMKYNIKS